MSIKTPDGEIITRIVFATVVGEVTGKGQLKGNDFCQFCRVFQVHEVGLGEGQDWG